MILYCTTEFVWPVEDIMNLHPRMLYLGPVRGDAIYYANRFPPVYEAPVITYPELLCSLPIGLKRTVHRYHNKGDLWCSVVSFDTKEMNNG